MRILVVDDSVVFRTQISASLKDVEGVEIVGTAANGKIALQKLEQLSVDLMTLDMEMPEMDGLATLKALKERRLSTKVIVFSSQTVKGAEKALDALANGATDVVCKPSDGELNFESAQKHIREALLPRVHQFMNTSRGLPPGSQIQGLPATRAPKRSGETIKAQAVVVASSTGGPNALEEIFSGLSVTAKVPVFIVQHMPPVFTDILAKRLSQISGMNVREAKHLELATPGTVYIAPGDYHMKLSKVANGVQIILDQSPQRNSVRPAADHLFETAAEIYGKNLKGIVLTGMGEDGARGARSIRDQGGFVMIQNKESCVVFGMPGAVYANDDFDTVGDLAEIRQTLQKAIA